MTRSENVPVRVQLVWPGQFARPRHPSGMAPSDATLGSQHAVIPVSLEQMGPSVNPGGVPWNIEEVPAAVVIVERRDSKPRRPVRESIFLCK